MADDSGFGFGLNIGQTGGKQEKEADTRIGFSPSQMQDMLQAFQGVVPLPDVAGTVQPSPLDLLSTGAQQAVPTTGRPAFVPTDPNIVRFADISSWWTQNAPNKWADLSRAMAGANVQPGSDLTVDQWRQVLNPMVDWADRETQAIFTGALGHLQNVADNNQQLWQQWGPQATGAPADAGLTPAQQQAQQAIGGAGQRIDLGVDAEQMSDRANEFLQLFGDTAEDFKGQAVDQFGAMFGRGEGDVSREGAVAPMRQLGELDPDLLHEEVGTLTEGVDPLIDFEVGQALLDEMIESRTTIPLEQMDFVAGNMERKIKNELASRGVQGPAVVRQIVRENLEPLARARVALVDGATADAVELWWGAKERVAFQNKANELQKSMWLDDIRSTDKQFVLDLLNTRDVTDLQVLSQRDLSNAEIATRLNISDQDLERTRMQTMGTLMSQEEQIRGTLTGQELQANVQLRVQKARAYLDALGLDIQAMAEDQKGQRELLRILQAEGQYQQNYLLAAWNAQQEIRLETISKLGDFARFSWAHEHTKGEGSGSTVGFEFT